jgi:hypothetical protein
MAEDLTENRSVPRLTYAEKGQILELTAPEYRQARITRLLSRSEPMIPSFFDTCGKEHVFQSMLGGPKKQDNTGVAITVT